MLLFFYWYLAHCQSVTELAMLSPSASAPQNATSIFGDPASNLPNKNSYLAFARTIIPKIIINQFIEVT